jgi:hypothetical protein
MALLGKAGLLFCSFGTALRFRPGRRPIMAGGRRFQEDDSGRAAMEGTTEAVHGARFVMAAELGGAGAGPKK